MRTTNKPFYGIKRGDEMRQLILGLCALMALITLCQSCGGEIDVWQTGSNNRSRSSRNSVQCNSYEWNVNRCIAMMSHQYGHQYAVNYCRSNTPINDCR